MLQGSSRLLVLHLPWPSGVSLACTHLCLCNEHTSGHGPEGPIGDASAALGAAKGAANTAAATVAVRRSEYFMLQGNL